MSCMQYLHLPLLIGLHFRPYLGRVLYQYRTGGVTPSPSASRCSSTMYYHLALCWRCSDRVYLGCSIQAYDMHNGIPSLASQLIRQHLMLRICYGMHTIPPFTTSNWGLFQALFGTRSVLVLHQQCTSGSHCQQMWQYYVLPCSTLLQVVFQGLFQASL